MKNETFTSTDLTAIPAKIYIRAKTEHRRKTYWLFLETENLKVEIFPVMVWQLKNLIDSGIPQLEDLTSTENSIS